jgi:hypothetical protein
MKMNFAKTRFYLSARFSLILLAGSALTFALFGSGVAVAQASKGAETIQTSQDLSAAPLPGGSYSGDGPLGAVWSLPAVSDFNGGDGPLGVLNWSLLAVSDFNGDSKPDYVLVNFSTRQTAIWYMNNNIFVSGAFGPTLPANWSLVAVGDFNGDSKPDYVLLNISTHQTAIWYMNNNIFVGGAFGPTIPP